MPKCKSLLGLFYALVASVFSALMGFFVKYVKQARMDQTLLLRCIVQYFFLLPVMQRNGRAFVEHNPRNNAFVAVVGLGGAVSSYTFFFSLNHLSVSDATAITWSAVILVGICACIFLKEQCGIIEVVFSTAALFGLLLITRPSFVFGIQTDHQNETNRTFGIILAIVAMWFSAVCVVTLRKLGDKVHFSIPLFYHALCTSVVSLISMRFGNAYVIPCTTDVIFMTSSALCGLLYLVFQTVALQKEAAGPVAIVTTSQVAITFLLEYFFLGVVPYASSIIGAALIMASIIGLTLINMRRNRVQR